jgi:RNA polymerase subunit RPABC4/transcription elongation factor Spt4
VNRFDEILSSINFKKAARIFVLLSVIILVICGAAVSYAMRDKLKMALDYNKVSESFRRNGNNNTLQSELLKLSSDSSDIVNCIVVDKNNSVIYKLNDNLVKGSDKFALTTLEANKKYLHDNINKDVVYRAASEENIILTKDYLKNHEQIVSDIDENLYFEKDLENKNVDLLNYLVNRDTKEKLYIMRTVPSMPIAESLVKTIGIIIGLIFIIYWIGVALWVYKDANQRKVNSALWGSIVLVTNIVGVIVYTMYKQTNKVCYRCGAIQSKDNIFCGSCGAQINERCDECSSIVGKNQNYCNSCGHKLRKSKD